jgi:hypothetical protein
MSKSLLIGAVSTLALVACANKGMDGGGMSATTVLDDLCATDQVRCIDVVIANGQITQVVDADFMGPNHLIVWRLKPAGAGFLFPNNGIAFKTTSPAPPPNEFNCRPVAQQHLFFCFNRNTVPRTYTYNVTLNPIGGGNPITKDPKIVNQ